MNISMIIIIIYIGLLFGISIYAKKLAGSGSENFILAGRKFSTPLVAVSITGLAIGGASTIGVSEQAFSVGLAAGWYNAAWGAGAILMGIVAAKRYRNLNVSTVPELFERFYDQKGRIICVIGQIVIQLVITSLQYVAGGAMLSSMMPEIFTIKTGMIMSAVVFVGITFIGGMMTAGLTNILNVILIYVGIILSTFTTISNQGGIKNIALKLPNASLYLNPTKGLSFAVIAGWFAVMMTMCLSIQGTVQISCSAKDAKSAKNGFILGGLLIIPIGFLSAYMGIAAKVAFPSINATLALPQIILSLSPVLAGTTLAALWAADVSTACGLLLGSAALFSNDIYKRFINPEADEKRLGFVTKASVMVLGIVTFILALNVAGIIKTLLIGLSLTTAFTVVFLFTMFAPKLCRKNSAFNTTVVGILVLVLWQFVPSIRIFSHVIYLEWIACVITFLITPLFDIKAINVAADILD